VSGAAAVATGASLVSLERVTKTYASGKVEVRALVDVTLELARGELTVILGPSGSGKTTLLNVIGALDSPSSGRVAVAGTDLTGLSEAARTRYRREEVGFVFQYFNLVPSLTARENVMLAAELVRAPRSVDGLLAAVGLGGRADHFPGQLSGGEQQRVAVARALVKDPAVILADEPTGSLDSATGSRIVALLEDLAREEGRAVLIVTHNAALARAADRVITLVDGQVAADRGRREATGTASAAR
jgi:putative ABC transport system ATP-binding protein